MQSLADQDCLPAMAELGQIDLEPPAMSKPCPFCNLAPERILFDNDLCGRLRGCASRIPRPRPRRPEAARGLVVRARRRGEAAVLELLDKLHAKAVRDRRPEAFNLGINDGKAAGRTVPTVHLHLIPRYDGDHPDPRGGIRWVLPGKATYWEEK